MSLTGLGSAELKSGVTVGLEADLWTQRSHRILYTSAPRRRSPFTFRGDTAEDCPARKNGTGKETGLKLVTPAVQSVVNTPKLGMMRSAQRIQRLGFGAPRAAPERPPNENQL